MKYFAAAAFVSVLLTTSHIAAARTAEEAAGELVFHRCMACHALDKPTTYGPTLVGVVGRKAGAVPSFEYSKAMTESGVVWTLDNLRKWMADNDGFMPGTRMRHVSISDPAEQDYLLAFLKSLQ